MVVVVLAVVVVVAVVTVVHIQQPRWEQNHLPSLVKPSSLLLSPTSVLPFVYPAYLVGSIPGVTVVVADVDSPDPWNVSICWRRLPCRRQHNRKLAAASAGQLRVGEGTSGKVAAMHSAGGGVEK